MTKKEQKDSAKNMAEKDVSTPVTPMEDQEEEKDPIDELLADVPEWLRGPLKENYKQILATIAIIIIVTVLWSGFSYYINQREAAASYNLGIAMSKKEVDERLNSLKEVIDKYGHTNAAKIAGIVIGQAYLEKGEFKKALSSFKEAGAEFNGALADTSFMGQGYAYEEQKELDSALKNFKKAENNKNGFEAIALLDEARIYKEKGENEEAIKAFNKYLDIEPKSPLLDFIRYQVLTLSN